MSHKKESLRKLKSLCYLTLGGSIAYQYVYFKKDFNGYFEKVIQPLNQYLNPEWSHKLGVAAIKYGVFPYDNKEDQDILKTKFLNHELNNPLGIAAGFDKHGDAVIGLRKLGFSIVEIGSITPEAQPGNPKPRVFRLPEDKAIVFSFSPNTPGLRSLQNKKELQELLSEVNKARTLMVNVKKPPLLLKLAPDLTPEEMKDVVSVITKKECGVDGLIISNTTIDRSSLANKTFVNELGGLSGGPLTDKSTEIIKQMYKLTKGKIPIIGVGGIFTGQDAYDKILAGASVVQLYTAFIYHGPPVISKIKNELADLLQRDGYKSVNDAVGKGVK